MPKVVPKIAEIWKISEVAEKAILEWMKPDDIERGESTCIDSLINETDEKKFIELQERCSAISGKKAKISLASNINKQRIYLDVTSLDYRSLGQAYSAINMCREELGINKRDQRSHLLFTPIQPDQETSIKALPSLILVD